MISGTQGMEEAVTLSPRHIWGFAFATLLALHTALAANTGHTFHLTPGEDIASLVAASPADSTFVFAPGLYRMQSILPKDGDIFRGKGKVILDGATALTMTQEGRRWSAVRVAATSSPSRCGKGHSRCWILNDLFLDDQLQLPVESLEALTPGHWFYDDAAGKIYIATDPTGRLVEWSTTSLAFYGSASNVHISHLIVEKYANPPQTGAVGGAHARALAWTVSNVEVRWNHGGGIGLGPDALVRSCYVHHNGQKGIGASGANIVIENNDISYNNYAGFDTGWEAGGTKFSGTDHLLVRSNHVHDNQGNGLWTDGANIHALIERNSVIDNTGEGIRHEVSYDAIIRDNLVKGNRVGIAVTLSPHVEVYGNVVEVPVDGIDGIRLMNGSRGSGAFGPYTIHDDHVRNNDITYLGRSGRSGFSGPLATATGLVFDFNKYHAADGSDKHWMWGSGLLTFAELRSQGLEQHGSFSDASRAIPDPTRRSHRDEDHERIPPIPLKKQSNRTRCKPITETQ